MFFADFIPGTTHLPPQSPAHLAFLFPGSSPDSPSAQTRRSQTDLPLHLQALEQALKGKVHHYEWGFEKDGKHFFYQTTLIPLRGEDRTVATVLALTRDITHWAKNYHEANMLKEGAVPQTFAQILLAEREAEKREISKSLHDEIGSSAVILTALLSLVKASVKEGDTKQALV